MIIDEPFSRTEQSDKVNHAAPNLDCDSPPYTTRIHSMVLVFMLLLIAISFTVTGELFLKAGMNQVGAFTPSFDVLVRTFTEWRVILGFGLIFSGALFWLGVISRVDLSFAYPMLALSYVISMIPAYFLLKEDISLNRVLGACIIIVGVVVINWHSH